MRRWSIVVIAVAAVGAWLAVLMLDEKRNTMATALATNALRSRFISNVVNAIVLERIYDGSCSKMGPDCARQAWMTFVERCGHGAYDVAVISSDTDSAHPGYFTARTKDGAKIRFVANNDVGETRCYCMIIISAIGRTWCVIATEGMKDGTAHSVAAVWRDTQSENDVWLKLEKYQAFDDLLEDDFWTHEWSRDGEGNALNVRQRSKVRK